MTHLLRARVGLVLLLAATVSSCSQRNPTEPTPPSTTVVNYTAIGASDAIGYGGSSPCLPFVSCPNGTGYVQLVGRRLEAAGKTVTLLNLGIPGSVLSPTIQSIANTIGRDAFGNFLEREVPFVSASSTLVTVFAGANDVNVIGAALDRGQGGNDPSGYVLAQTQTFGRDMRALVAAVKDRAPQARIVILNLPNMAAMPYAGGYTVVQKRWLQQIAVGFSAEINALTSQGVLVIDLMCDAGMYQASIYSSDGFHPNDSGYARLADLTYAAASTGSASPPRASCSQMTVF